MRRRTVVHVLAALLAVAASACGAAARPPAEAREELPPVLLPVGALPGDFMLRQHVTARYEERSDGFDAVLQKRGDELTLVGLGPMSTVGFVLKLSERGVELDNRSGRELPFRPEHILADVQRVFYPWLPPAERCDACVREGEAEGLALTERYEAGRLRERRFRWAAAPERGEVVVRYEGWGTSELAPARVSLDNGWYGYALVIETVGVGGEGEP